MQTSIKAFVTDNAANIVCAVKLFWSPKPSKHIGCFAHTLNLIVFEDSITTNVILCDILSKVKAIVTFLKKEREHLIFYVEKHSLS